MDKVLRFSDYNVFAYIASGLAALLLCDLLLGTHAVVGAQWSVAEGAAITFAAYVIGHVVAWPASWLIERQFVARLLGPPSKVLFVERKQHTALARLLFPDYFTPLDHALRQRVKAHASDPADHSGRSLFCLAAPVENVRIQHLPLRYRPNPAPFSAASGPANFGGDLWTSRMADSRTRFSDGPVFSGAPKSPN